MPLDTAQWQIDILAADRTGQAFSTVDKRLKAMQSTQDDVAESLKSLAGVAETFEGVAKGMIGLATISRLQAWHESVQAAGVAIKDQADAANLSTNALQTWQAAFRAANSNVEAGVGAVTTFSKAARAAASGNKEAAEAFITLGVRILDSNGKLRDQNAILLETSRAMLAAGDSVKAAAAGQMLFGQSGDALGRTLRETSRSFTDLQDAAQRAGQVMNTEAIETFVNLKNRSEEADNRVRNLYAALAAPLHLAAVEAANRAFANLAENIGKARGNWMILVELFTNPFGTAAKLGWTTELKDDLDQIAFKERELAELRKPLAEGTLDRNPYRQQRIQALEKELGLLRQRQQVLSVAGKQTASSSDPDNIGILPTVTVAGNRFAQPAAAGTGSAERDRIGEELRRLTGEADSAREAYERFAVAAKTAASTEDLQRQVNLQKAIGDELARIGKYSQNDPRIPQLKQIITEHETWEYRLKSLDAALKAADTTEKQFGDGTAELTRRQTELNEALATGRLSQDAYAAALKAAQRQQEDQARTARGAAGGFDALVAGVEQGAADLGRANSAFEIGKRGVAEFTAELGKLASGAETDFGKVAQSFAQMVLQMELQAAASNVWNALTGKGPTNHGIFGGLLSNLFGGGVTAGPAPSGGYGGYTGYANTLPGFAGGGDTPAGTPFVVGENGAEVMISGSRGHVYNQRQLAGMGSGDVYVNIVNNNGSAVSARKRKGPGGQMQVNILIETLEGRLAARMANGQGALGKTVEGKYGLQPVGR